MRTTDTHNMISTTPKNRRGNKRRRGISLKSCQGAKDAQRMLKRACCCRQFPHETTPTQKTQTSRNWQAKAANQTKPSPCCHPWQGATMVDCVNGRTDAISRRRAPWSNYKKKELRPDLEPNPKLAMTVKAPRYRAIGTFNTSPK